MIKKTNSISINILSVFIILICLLLTCVSTTNAWFTSEKKAGVLIEVSVGTLKLNVYQEIDETETKLLTDADNANPSITNKQYIELEQVIEPDVPVNLVLTLKNEDEGSASMYVKFKLELYSRGVTSDTLIPLEIDGFTAPSTVEGNVHAGFVLNSENGYYYYKDSTGTENAPFAKGTTATMMETFTIDYTNFIDSNGNMLITNSETVYFKLIVDASVSKTF